MTLDVDGVGYAASVLEGCVGGTIDEAHRAAVGVFVRDEVMAIAPFPEIRLTVVFLCPFLYRNL